MSDNQNAVRDPQIFPKLLRNLTNWNVIPKWTVMSGAVFWCTVRIFMPYLMTCQNINKCLNDFLFSVSSCVLVKKGNSITKHWLTVWDYGVVCKCTKCGNCYVMCHSPCGSDRPWNWHSEFGSWPGDPYALLSKTPGWCPQTQTNCSLHGCRLPRTCEIRQKLHGL